MQSFVDGRFWPIASTMKVGFGVTHAHRLLPASRSTTGAALIDLLVTFVAPTRESESKLKKGRRAFSRPLSQL